MLTSGYLNAKDLFFGVLGAAGWQLTNLTANVGWFGSSTYLLTFNVLDQYTDADIVNQLFIDLSPYITNPQIAIVSGSVRRIDPNQANNPSGAGSDFLRYLGFGLGSGAGTTAGISIPLAVGAVLIFGVLYFNKK